MHHQADIRVRHSWKPKPWWKQVSRVLSKHIISLHLRDSTLVTQPFHSDGHLRHTKDGKAQGNLKKVCLMKLELQSYLYWLRFHKYRLTVTWVCIYIHNIPMYFVCHPRLVVHPSTRQANSNTFSREHFKHRPQRISTKKIPRKMYSQSNNTKHTKKQDTISKSLQKQQPTDSDLQIIQPLNL